MFTYKREITHLEAIHGRPQPLSILLYFFVSNTFHAPNGVSSVQLRSSKFLDGLQSSNQVKLRAHESMVMIRTYRKISALSSGHRS